MKLLQKLRSPLAVWLVASILPFLVMAILIVLEFEMLWLNNFPEPLNHLFLLLLMVLPSYLVFLMGTEPRKKQLSSIGLFTLLQPLYLGGLFAFGLVLSCAVHWHCP